jgi:hypothetical protein
MFIDSSMMPSLAPFEGTEDNVNFFIRESFRSFERSQPWVCS